MLDNRDNVVNQDEQEMLELRDQTESLEHLEYRDHREKLENQDDLEVKVNCLVYLYGQKMMLLMVFAKKRISILYCASVSCSSCIFNIR